MVPLSPKTARPTRFVRHQNWQRDDNSVVQKHGDSQECRNCGSKFEKGHLDVCKARNQACRFCKKIGHFERKCRSKARQAQTTHTLTVCSSNYSNEENTTIVTDNNAETYSDQSDDDYLFRVAEQGKPRNSPVDVKARVADQPKHVGFLVDSGSTVNILLYQDYQQLLGKSHDPKLKLNKSNAVTKPFNSSTPVKVLGEFTATIETCSYKKTPVKEMFTIGTFQVVEGETPATVSILGRKTAIELGMLRVGPAECPNSDQEFVAAIHSDVSPATKHGLNKLLKDYDSLFDGVGKSQNYKHKLHLDPSVKPVIEKHRRLLFHQRNIASKILHDLRQKDIIEKVPPGTPITHLSNIHLVPKDNDPHGARFTVDLGQLNKSIKREHHIMPTFEEMCDDLQNAKYFCKADMNHAYFQIELDENSRNLTCFSTHEGIHRFKRLTQGCSASGDAFQYIIAENICSGLKGVKNNQDDFLLYASTEKQMLERLQVFFERCKQKGITLKRTKCEFLLSSIKYFGRIISRNGISPDPAKVEAIQAIPVMTSTKEVRSFLSLVNFCSPFIPNLSQKAAPLRRLLNSQTKFEWTPECDKAFQDIKAAISNDCLLAHFNPALSTYVIVDASIFGLGSVVCQAHTNSDNVTYLRPIVYSSRSVSNVETRYSQTELETLGAVWGCERNKLYLLGHHFTLIGDHQPLAGLLKPGSRPPARIIRWLLRLQCFDFTFKYRPGHWNPIDVLSRKPLLVSDTEMNSMGGEQYIRFVVAHAIPKSMTLDEIRKHTINDVFCCKLMEAIKTGQWSDPNLAYVRAFRHEFSCIDNIVLRSNRITIPTSLQSKVLNLGHTGHQGIVKTKQYLRTKVWWLGMDKDVEELIKSCSTCYVSMATCSFGLFRPISHK